VMTADCLPALFCDLDGSAVAAAHAGWRGLAGGVLEATVAALDVDPARLLAWLGPAIGPGAFEVGAEVRAAFLAGHPQAAAAFVAQPDGRWLADLYRLAGIRLRAAGVTAIHGGGFCTYSERERFYSFRRDRVTGRMASLIWLD
jgi:YfiH family protein